jgi:exonuclease SbcD
VPAAAFPASAAYVALGHLHRAQQIPGAAPIWYCGSPIQVDFGEERDVKQVLLIDAAGSGAARVTPVHLRSGWKLRTISGTLAELTGLAVDADEFVRVFVREPQRAGLADEVRAFLPNAVDVRIVADPSTARAEVVAAERKAAMLPRELFAAYLDVAGHDRDERLLALFDELLDAESV